MQGVFVRGQRPTSKKMVKEAVAADPRSVRLQGTSMTGTDFDGLVADAPMGTYHFVGPDPYTSRKFYGTVLVSPAGVKVK